MRDLPADGYRDLVRSLVRVPEKLLPSHPSGTVAVLSRFLRPSVLFLSKKKLPTELSGTGWVLHSKETAQGPEEGTCLTDDL